MPESRSSSSAGLIGQVRSRLSESLRAQTEEIERLEQNLQSLRERHEQFKDSVQEQLEALAKSGGGGSSSSAPAASAPLDKVLASVRNLITATLPEQVFVTLAEEAEQLGVRAAVFEIRGKTAWGAAARGFGAEVSDQAFRALVVPLNKSHPFRLAYETGGDVEATGDDLKKCRNVFDRFQPADEEPILILPIRSAGSVSALFYSDSTGSGQELPVDALKILAEFTGAQLDRLMALSGTLAAAQEGAAAHAEDEGAEAQEQEVAASDGEEVSSADLSSPPEASATDFARQPGAASTSEAGGFDISQFGEDEQRIHKDARRFAKLLVSEIELYNKAKVAEGRKNQDLYRRLKTDIERSRHTYEKRFGKTVAKQVDYFHQELVRTLAGNNPAFLGSDYPGPSV